MNPEAPLPGWATIAWWAGSAIVLITLYITALNRATAVLVKELENEKEAREQAIASETKAREIAIAHAQQIAGKEIEAEREARRVADSALEKADTTIRHDRRNDQIILEEHGRRIGATEEKLTAVKERLEVAERRINGGAKL